MRFAAAMQDAPEQRESDDGPAPLGSWSRLYLLVAALAIVVMLLLFALTATFNLKGNA